MVTSSTMMNTEYRDHGEPWTLKVASLNTTLALGRRRVRSSGTSSLLPGRLPSSRATEMGVRAIYKAWPSSPSSCFHSPGIFFRERSLNHSLHMTRPVRRSSHWIICTTPLAYLPYMPRVSGQTDVLAFRSVGLSRDEYIGNLNLPLTDQSTNIPLYYIVVKALNGAGKESTILSSRYDELI